MTPLLEYTTLIFVTFSSSKVPKISLKYSRTSTGHEIGSKESCFKNWFHTKTKFYFKEIDSFGTWEKHIILSMRIMTYKNIERIEQEPFKDKKTWGWWNRDSHEELLLLQTVWLAVLPCHCCTYFITKSGPEYLNIKKALNFKVMVHNLFNSEVFCMLYITCHPRLPNISYWISSEIAHLGGKTATLVTLVIGLHWPRTIMKSCQAPMAILLASIIKLYRHIFIPFKIIKTIFL